METEGKVLCVVLGGGGHARVVIDLLRDVAACTPYAVLDVDSSLWGRELLGVPVRGGDELLLDLIDQGVTHFVVGVGSVGNHEPRRRLFELGLSYGLVPLTVLHPSAVFSSYAQVGQGTVVLPLAVVNAGAVIGNNVIINTGAIVEHDCVVADHAHVATGARLAGAVKVGAGAHVGAGATVREGACIGEGAIVGAGAVVVRDVPSHTVVAGVPAKVLKSGRPTSAESLLTARKAVR